MVHETAFNECSNLTTVRFFNEIEEFVSGEMMQDWWNCGVYEKCLSTYCFLVQFSIPERVSLVQSTISLTNIHGMIERIPSISPEGLNAHVRSINSKLSAYEGSTMLELAICKLNIEEQTDGVIYLLNDGMKMTCCIDSHQWLTLSFLTFFPSSMALAIKIDWYLCDLHIPNL